MKKILAISSIFLMMTAVFTGCGADRDYDRDDKNQEESEAL